MTDSTNESRRGFITATLSGPRPAAADELAVAIMEKHPGSAVMLYGSGISVLEGVDAADVLYDFYVISPSYREAFGSTFLSILNAMLPPNVFYIEKSSELGLLRAKYAVLSIDHFEKLVSNKTFHSYFWARFAQPARMIAGPDGLRARIVKCVETSVDTFLSRSISTTTERASVNAIWKAGLSKSYKAELRAEAPGRVDKLLSAYGEWPDKVTNLKTITPRGGALGWRLRAMQGGILSVLRLLKGTFTFEGGVDYIAWKISRHAGFSVPVRGWERRWPILGAPFLMSRYYRMKRAHAR